MEPKCFSYIRFSSLEQQKGDSLRRQTEMAEEWAEKNGMVIDESLSLKDLGLSAFSGAHRIKGALSQFLKLVENDKIPSGSVLLVESLDRLSREEELEALTQFLAIINKGIKIVTLADGAREYAKESIDSMRLMQSLMVMGRAHEESLTKSKRGKEAWNNKRKLITKKKLTARCPAWLVLSDDKKTFNVVKERAETIERIFHLKLEGMGGDSIARKLNQDGVDWDKSRGPRRVLKNGWRKSYIDKILRNRAILGEFQPYTKKDGKRQPAGDPIPDYFPRIIEDGLFYSVQRQMAMNRSKGGRNGELKNLFGALARCGYCGKPMRRINKGKKPKGGQYLVCDSAKRGRGCECHLISYPIFEELVLGHCRGLSVADLLPDADNAKTAQNIAQDRLAGIKGEKVEIDRKVARLIDTVESTDDKRVRATIEVRMKDLLDKSERLAIWEKKAQQELTELNSASETTQENLKSVKELYDLLQMENSTELRMRLRGRLRQVIDHIDVYPVGRYLMNEKNVEKQIEAVLDIQPELAGTEELEKISAELTEKIGNKANAICSIYFKGGSFRTLNLGGKSPILVLDLNREAQKFTNQYLDLNGEVEKFVIQS